MSLYQPVKYALIIILVIGLVVVIGTLKPELERSRSNTNHVVMLVLQLFILVLGLVGSYRDNRQLLLTFAIILAIVVIVAVVQNQAVAVIGNAVLDLVAIVLAWYQSHLIQTGGIL